MGRMDWMDDGMDDGRIQGKFHFIPTSLTIYDTLVWVCLLGVGYQCDVWVSQIVFVLILNSIISISK